MGKQPSAIDIFRYRTFNDLLQIDDPELTEYIQDVLTYINPKREISHRYKNSYFILKTKYTSLFELPWGNIITIRQVLQTGNNDFNTMYQILGQVFDIASENHFLNCSIFDAFGAYKWVKEEMTKIAQWELENLQSKPTSKELLAGIERFNELGIFPSVDGIANGDITNFEAVYNVPYGRVLRKLRLNKMRDEYFKELHKPKK